MREGGKARRGKDRERLMAIEKMKKLRLLAVRGQKEELLRDLLLLGCVEVSEPEDSELQPGIRSCLQEKAADCCGTGQATRS